VLIAAVLVAVLVGTLAQSISGIGFALVCGPLLVAALGPQDGVRLSVLLSLVLNSVLLARLWREVDVRTTLLLLAPAALTTPLFAVLARRLPERAGAAAAGAVVVVGVAVLALGVRWHAARGRRGAVAAGVLGALTNVLAGVAGPVVALWAANAEWPQRVQRASLQAFFLGLNCVALPALGTPHVGAGTARRLPGRRRRRARARRAAVAPHRRDGRPPHHAGAGRAPGARSCCVRALLGELEDAEHEQQDDRERDGQQQAAEAPQAVGEEEEHARAVPRRTDVRPVCRPPPLHRARRAGWPSRASSTSVVT
jgi:uncharacterized membrane protein YfcA